MSLQSRRLAVKISAAAAADNFGWLGGAPSVFRRRRRRTIPAGGGGASRRLRGLPVTPPSKFFRAAAVAFHVQFFDAMFIY